MIFQDDDFILMLEKRYASIHLLVIKRSLDRAHDIHELFEILESVPKKPPFSWDENSRRWKKNMDILAKKKKKKMR